MNVLTECLSQGTSPASVISFAKEYLKQAFYLDKRINSKLEQVESLNALATKATSTLSDMPKSPNRGTSKT